MQVVQDNSAMQDFEINDLKDVKWAFKLVNKEIDDLTSQMKLLTENVNNLTNISNTTVKLFKIAGAVIAGISLILQVHSWYSDVFTPHSKTEMVQTK